MYAAIASLAVMLLVASLAEPNDAAAAPQNPGPLNGSWVRMAEHAAFTPRDTAEAVVYHDRMWLSNAFHVGNVLVRDLWSSDDGVNWRQVLDATPYDGYAEMAVYRNKMWAVKGSVWRSTDGVKWYKIADQTPFGTRGYGELVVHDGKLWQLGTGSDVWWTTDGVNWTCATKQAPYGDRYATSTIVFGGKLWVMGGTLAKASDPPEKGYAKYTTHNDVWCSADGANWTRVTEHAPWARRMWSVPIIYKDRMWILGGYSNAEAHNLGDVWYTEDGTNWHEFVSERPGFSPRHEVSAYVFKGELWVVAGNAWPLMNDVWKLELSAK